MPSAPGASSFRRQLSQLLDIDDLAGSSATLDWFVLEKRFRSWEDLLLLTRQDLFHHHHQQQGGGGGRDEYYGVFSNSVVRRKLFTLQTFLQLGHGIDHETTWAVVAQTVHRSSHQQQSQQQQQHQQPVVMAQAVVEPMQDLPSNLEYKDLGRDLESVLPSRPPLVAVAAEPHQQQHQQHHAPIGSSQGITSVLPDNIEYKDQGRNIQSFLGNNDVQQGEPPQPPLRAPSTPQGTTIFSEYPQADPPRSCRKKTWIAVVVVVMVLLVVVAIVVAVVVSSKETSSTDRTLPVGLSSSPAPSVVTTTFPVASPPLILPPVNSLTNAPTVDTTPALTPTKPSSSPVPEMPETNPPVNAVTRPPWQSSPETTPTTAPTETSRPRSWVQLGSNITGDTTNRFGREISLSSDGLTLAVMAPSSTGEIQVYSFDSNGRQDWVLKGRPVVGVSGNWLTEVALSGDGSTFAAGSGSRDFVRIYRFNSTTVEWVQLDQIAGPSDSQFGHSVTLSMDGNRFATGARSSDNVFAYEYTPGVGFQQLGQTITLTSGGGLFGETVSLSANGERLAIGDHQDSTLRVYQLIGGTVWSQIGDTIVEPENFLGIALALSEDGTTMIGGGTLNDEIAQNAGYARVLRYDSSSEWQALGQNLYGRTQFDLFGNSVAISFDGTVVAIGFGDESRYKVFRLTDDRWEEFGEFYLGAEATSGFEGEVRLSADGRIIVMSSVRYGNVQAFRWQS